MASKVTFPVVATLAVATLLYPMGGCAGRAYADEYLVADDYATSNQVSQLTGAVNALTGTVSGDLRDMQTDVGVLGETVNQMMGSQGVQGESIESVKDTAEKTAEGVKAANDALDAQGKELANIRADIRSLGEQEGESAASDVSQLSTSELLALVPDDAAGAITEYIQYPFLWGVASGVVAYIISLVVAAIYRLLGFR